MAIHLVIYVWTKHKIDHFISESQNSQNGSVEKEQNKQKRYMYLVS